MSTPERNFLVLKWTPVFLDWREVLSSWDFTVSFSWKVLDEIEGIKKWINRTIMPEQIYFPVTTEHWRVHINVDNMLSMH